VIYNTIIDDVMVRSEITHRGYDKNELRPGELEYDIEILGAEPEGIFKEKELEALVLKDFQDVVRQKREDEIENLINH